MDQRIGPEPNLRAFEPHAAESHSRNDQQTLRSNPTLANLWRGPLCRGPCSPFDRRAERFDAPTIRQRAGEAARTSPAPWLAQITDETCPAYRADMGNTPDGCGSSRLVDWQLASYDRWTAAAETRCHCTAAGGPTQRDEARYRRSTERDASGDVLSGHRLAALLVPFVPHGPLQGRSRRGRS